MILKKISLLLTVGLALSGCLSARMEDREPDRLFFMGQYSESAELLKKGLTAVGDDHRDALLYLLDLGLALHMAGNYAESTKVFLKADYRSEIFDYSSLGEDATTLLVSDNSKPYRTEDFESVLISTYLALNFAFENKTEDALVEVRRINRKLTRLIQETHRKYKLDAFSKYLSGILYESARDFEDAYLDYKAVVELQPSFVSAGEDLYRLAVRLRRRDEASSWKSRFSISDSRAEELKKMNAGEWGELVVVFQNGISPIKKPHEGFHSVPVFKPRHNPVTQSEVWIDGALSTQTQVLKNVEQTAIENLEEKWGGIVAKKIAGAIAKEAAGAVVANATKSEELGALIKIALWASDQADLRSWNLLPKDLQIARIAMTEGSHVVHLKPIGAGVLPEKKVEIKKGKTTFVNFRYISSY